MSQTRRARRRPGRFSAGASTDLGGGACFLLVLVPGVAAALACLVTLAVTGQTTTPTMLRQLAVAAGGRVEAPAAPPAGEDEDGRGRLARLFTPEVLYWEGRILSWAGEWNLDPNLVATVMQIESCGDPLARSRAGAMGLFQVMPYHFGPGELPYEPSTNARRGLAYLSDSLATHGGVRLALAGYNGGIQAASRAEFTWSAETMRYAYWGSGIYADAAAGAVESERLAEWLAAGGASLCAQAAERLGLAP
jgi:hypothetical protein